MPDYFQMCALLRVPTYFYGAKEWAGNPAGPFQDMLPEGEFINVSSNYRLGAYGWMYFEREDMTPNAGIWDGRAAVNWTKNHIHLFGGDPDPPIGQGGFVTFAKDAVFACYGRWICERHLARRCDLLLEMMRDNRNGW